MTLVGQISLFVARAATEFKAVRTLIGGSSTSGISGLTTVTKASLVDAINEAASNAVIDARMRSGLRAASVDSGILSDANTAVNNGIYYLTSGAANAPTTGAGFYYHLTVENLDNNWRVQVAKRIDGNYAGSFIYIRWYNGISTAWTAWERTMLTQTEMDNRYQAAITAGTATQYYRGDKTFQTLNAAAVGLGSVPNVDATNAANISSGILPDARYPNGVQTPSGNDWNNAIASGIYSGNTLANAPFGGWVQVTVHQLAGNPAYCHQLAYSSDHNAGVWRRLLANGVWGSWVNVIDTITGDARYIQGADSRLADSRTPTGAAGGGLTGTYPNPGVAYGTSGSTAAAGNDSRLVGNAKSYGGGQEGTAALATSGTVTANLSSASIFTVTPTAAITLACSNVPASGIACTITFVITQGTTAFAITMPTGTVWVTPTPTQVASKVCVITAMTVNGGTTWYASATVQP